MSQQTSHPGRRKIFELTDTFTPAEWAQSPAWLAFRMRLPFDTARHLVEALQHKASRDSIWEIFRKSEPYNDPEFRRILNEVKDALESMLIFNQAEADPYQRESLLIMALYQKDLDISRPLARLETKVTKSAFRDEKWVDARRQLLMQKEVYQNTLRGILPPKTIWPNLQNLALLHALIQTLHIRMGSFLQTPQPQDDTVMNLARQVVSDLPDEARVLALYIQVLEYLNDPLGTAHDPLELTRRAYTLISRRDSARDIQFTLTNFLQRKALQPEYTAVLPQLSALFSLAISQAKKDPVNPSWLKNYLIIRVLIIENEQDLRQRALLEASLLSELDASKPLIPKDAHTELALTINNVLNFLMGRYRMVSGEIFNRNLTPINRIGQRFIHLLCRLALDAGNDPGLEVAFKSAEQFVHRQKKLPEHQKTSNLRRIHFARAVLHIPAPAARVALRAELEKEPPFVGRTWILAQYNKWPVTE
jgi:hypothetical protein